MVLLIVLAMVFSVRLYFNNAMPPENIHNYNIYSGAKFSFEFPGNSLGNSIFHKTQSKPQYPTE